MGSSRRLAFAFLLIGGIARAQVSETINVSVVEVPVTVVDRDGNPVRGLKAENFELFDNGQKQPLSSFDAIDFASYESRSVSPLNPVARRSFLLLFDLSFSSPSSLAKAQQAARNFLARGAARRDVVAIGTIDADRGFRYLTAFTTDRNLLNAAIADPKKFVASDPLQIAGSSLLDPHDVHSATMSAGKGSAADMEFREVMQQQQRLDDAYGRQRIQRHLSSLGQLARSLRAIPGRKQIILFSEGFDPRLVRGRDASSGKEAAEELDQIVNGDLWRTDPDARYGTSDSLTALKKMAEEFRAADVVLNSIDIKGVRVNNDLREGAKLSSNEGLYLMSQPTGGTMFHNSNDLGDDMQRMLRAQEVVYVLAMHAPASKPGALHQLRVKLVNAPAGSHAFSRAGYYEAGAENALERSLTNAEIVLNDVAQSDVPVAALAAPFPTNGTRAQVPVVLEIDGNALLRDVKGTAASADVYVYAFDDDGLVRDRLYQRVSLDVAKVGDRLRGSGVKYFGTLSLPQGRYAVKSLVRVVETERRGFARVDVVVPDRDDVAILPPLFFDEPGSWLIVHGASHDRASAYPFMLNGEPFMPSASAHVANGKPRKYALFVFNASPDEVVFEATARGRAQAPTLVSQVRARDADMTKLVFQFAPGGLAPGPSSFDVTLHRKGSGDVRKSSVSLIVEKP